MSVNCSRGFTVQASIEPILLAMNPAATLVVRHRTRGSPGFTLIEVMVALIVLGVGILALSGSSAMVNRMIGRGRVETHAALLAARRVEKLRMGAAATSPRCTSPSFASGGPVWEDGLRQSWTVDPSGPVRKVRVSVSYLTIRGSRAAVLETGIPC